MKPVNRDQFLFKMRDGELAEAKKVLEGANIGRKRSSLDQNFLFYASARARRGSEHLAKICVRMGVDLGEIDRNQQTALFYAASRGITTMVRFLLNLGFEDVRGKFPDDINESAVFYAISSKHHDRTHILIERGATLPTCHVIRNPGRRRAKLLTPQRIRAPVPLHDSR